MTTKIPKRPPGQSDAAYFRETGVCPAKLARWTKGWDRVHLVDADVTLGALGTFRCRMELRSRAGRYCGSRSAPVAVTALAAPGYRPGEALPGKNPADKLAATVQALFRAARTGDVGAPDVDVGLRRSLCDAMLYAAVSVAVARGEFAGPAVTL